MWIVGYIITDKGTYVHVGTAYGPSGQVKVGID